MIFMDVIKPVDRLSDSEDIAIMVNGNLSQQEILNNIMFTIKLTQTNHPNKTSWLQL